MVKCKKHGTEMVRVRFFRQLGDKVGYLAPPHCPDCAKESAMGQAFRMVVKDG